MPNEVLERCPMCQKDFESGTTSKDFASDIFDLNCARCGHYKAEWDVIKNAIPQMKMGDVVRLRGAVRELADIAFLTQDTPPLIRRENLPSYLSMAPEAFDASAKVRKLLTAIARASAKLGDVREIDESRDYALAYAADEYEFGFIVEYARNQAWIDGVEVRGPSEYHLTPAGWELVSRRHQVDSIQGFVAMAFVEDMRPIYDDALSPAIRDDCGFECKRIDAKEFNGGIVDEIKAEIRQSRFVVADVTHHRNGVYYEAGFADGLGIPIIWTCNEADANNTHFDTRHLNQIRWTSGEDLRKKLMNRILATIGKGPLAPRAGTCR